jgi:hypothetical protein
VNAFNKSWEPLLDTVAMSIFGFDAFEINRKRNDLGQDQANQISLETQGKYVKRGFLDAEDFYNHQCHVN